MGDEPNEEIAKNLRSEVMGAVQRNMMSNAQMALTALLNDGMSIRQSSAAVARVMLGCAWVIAGGGKKIGEEGVPDIEIFAQAARQVAEAVKIG